VKYTFGISIEPNWPVRCSIEIATLSERLGFANLWVPDSGPMPPYSDAIVTLSAIAAATSKIKIGSAILNFYTRNPALLASSFMALSDLAGKRNSSKSRVILGLGVGAEFNVAKLGVTERKGMMDEMREAIESIRELFQGKLVTVRTDSFVIDGVSLGKSPVQIPIYLGTGSPKGLRLAGGLADGVILADRIPQDIEKSLELVILGIGYASRKRSEVEIVDSVVISVDENPERARKAAAVTCAYLVAWMEDDKAEKHGIDLKTKAKIGELIARGEEAAARKLVTRHMIDLLTVSGNVQDCIEKCREYLKFDVDQLVFCEPFGLKPLESIRTIGTKIVPKL
jgi:5,10-methylenetetrahydromethanopterin reductase